MTFDVVSNTSKSRVPTNQRLILFGASINGVRALNTLGLDFDIVAFADNNQTLQGTIIQGIPVVAPVELSNLEFDVVAITSQSVEIIRGQLLDLGIEDRRITVFEQAVLVNLGTRRIPKGHRNAMILNDEDAGFLEIWEKCLPYTMTSFERGLSLYRAVRHLVRTEVVGSFVECGIWRGGSSMIAMLALIQFGYKDRNFFLFDTFSGMTIPCEHDADLLGRSAQYLLDKSREERRTSLIWAHAELDEVRRNIATTGYDIENVKFVKGDVMKTLGGIDTGKIALLRLDTDFYQSTLAELDSLYPRLVRNGVLIIDDFGHWKGARLAVEHYFERNKAKIAPPLFHRIDYTGRMGIRTDFPSCKKPWRYDYRPKGLKDPQLLSHFPSLIPSDPNTLKWPYLRRKATHIWRMDSRNIGNVPTGVLSIEEALLLYNNALLFKGKRGVEIGCHLGWSTAHLLSAGIRLDIIDPELHKPDQRAWVESSLRTLKEGDFRLWAGYSPSIIKPIATHEVELWSFAFIDGNHEGDSPQQDAEAVSKYCADNACIMFHDLASPWVARGLNALQTLGWSVGIYNTMQIMGIAWRGNMMPVRHIMDSGLPMVDDDLLEVFPLLSVRG